eukprot:snap_masked-scaffold68_size422247-processed-gene-0.2 protein:Tk11383 transcript:snap_masked-scaffold68_size422247-processed-gene-0.2-mRNA-1 annotation:"folylpolyglutamate mitochondrial-like"
MADIVHQTQCFILTRTLHHGIILAPLFGRMCATADFGSQAFGHVCESVDDDDDQNAVQLNSEEVAEWPRQQLEWERAEMEMAEKRVFRVLAIEFRAAQDPGRLVMTSPIQDRRLHSYDEAIIALNSLQSNAVTIKQSLAGRQKNAPLNLPRTLGFLEKSGLTLDDLRRVKFIHVSGTKGKGSTSAFVDSILRRHGLKTGFFSSPHLVTATERVRLEGLPISQEKFTPYFWSIFDKLCGPEEEDRPPYFMFWTLLAFHVFVKEQVDVAIMEVGIGGSFDCTNVIPDPVICGITALGIDHTSLLGHTIEEIAWHKAGIMKKGALTFVDNQQPEAALRVIMKEADQVGAKAWVVPTLEEYDWGSFPYKRLGLFGHVQEKNASLALQITRAFLQILRGKSASTFEGPKPFRLEVEDALGLRLCFWPGRSQTIVLDDMVFLLDGAHTKESMEACRDWFRHESDNQLNQMDQRVDRSQIFKFLLFNSTGDHPFEEMLSILSDLDIDMIVFCTNSASSKITDNLNYMSTMKDRMERCQSHKAAWDKCEPSTPFVIIPHIDHAVAWIGQFHHRGRFNGLADRWNVDQLEEDAGIQCPKRLSEAAQVHVLVTGSLHLIGGVMEIIQPDISSKSPNEIKLEKAIERHYQSLNQKDVASSNGI